MLGKEKNSLEMEAETLLSINAQEAGIEGGESSAQICMEMDNVGLETQRNQTKSIIGEHDTDKPLESGKLPGRTWTRLNHKFN